MAEIFEPVTIEDSFALIPEGRPNALVGALREFLAEADGGRRAHECSL